MNRQEREKLIREHLKGNVTSESKQVFNSWFRSAQLDPAHTLSQEEVEDAVRRIEVTLKNKMVIPERVRPRRQWFRYAAAVAASVVVLVVAFLSLGEGNGVYDLWHPIRYTQYQTGRGEQQTLRLPDGTEVLLNENSRFTITNRFVTASTRAVALRGEAFFVVAKNKQRPFTVSAGEGTVRVLGTRFSINTNTPDSAVIVAVEEGLVAFGREDDDSLHLRLGSGQSATLPLGAAVQRNTRTADSNYYSWKTGTVAFNNVALSDVFRQLSEIYHCRIVFDARQFDTQYITLQYPYTSVNRVLQVINKTHALAFHEAGGVITIRSMKP